MSGKSKPIFEKEVCAVFDVMYDLTCGPHTIETVRTKMHRTREMGIRKVYLVAQQDVSSVWQKDHPTISPAGVRHYVMQSVLTLGDPWFQYIRLAKEAGLEVIVRYKPYESGGSYSLPDNVKPMLPYNLLPELGGNGYGYPDFIFRHPDLRVRRLNFIPENRPITAVEFAFFAEPVTVRSIVDGTTCTLASEDVPFSQVEFFYSIHNGEYTKIDVPFRAFMERRIIPKIDGSGKPLFPGAKLCRILRFENLHLPENAGYVGIRYADTKMHFTLPFTMVKLYSGAEEISCTASCIPRHKPMLLENGHFIGDGPLDFVCNGFEFESIESIFWGDGVYAPDLGIGVARGKMEYMKGAVCEAYPQVQEYWMGRIKEFLDMGADGISIRFRCHSCSVLDFAQYGGNDPLLNKYRELYGDTTEIEAEKMMRIRGDFFLKFYQKAAAFLHAKGKTLECDLQADFSDPHFDIDYNHVGFWTMPKILPDCQKLVELSDVMTLNDYNHSRYTPELGGSIKDLAKAQNRAMHLHCYLQQGDDLNPEFLSAVQQDDRITGIELYEMVDNRGCGYAKAEWSRRGVFYVDENSQVHVNPEILSRLQKFTALVEAAESSNVRSF